MRLFNRKSTPAPASAPVAAATNPSPLAEMALSTIHDGVIITDDKGVIQYMNPAAAAMTEAGTPNNAVGLDYGLFMKLESKDGAAIADSDNLLIQSMNLGKPIEKLVACLVTRTSEKRIPVAISLVIANGGSSHRIITFRNVAKELAEEDEQAEFISTASHEMRTPVASIEGYLSLSLNPQTATIDERAKGYLESAHAASQHLGQLFRDLLDVTKLDDNRDKMHLEPTEMVSAVKQIANDHVVQMQEANLLYTFGPTSNNITDSSKHHRLEQKVYSNVDKDFLREIVDNLIENAIKYTPSGGSIYVNVLGDGDRTLINVTDTGIGISSDDIHHIFQKFYRADNSDTRTIGGTGLGLYIVKKRVEAMDGRIWVESAFGEGSTFYVSLPRISGSEYEKLITIAQNTKAMTAPTLTNAIPGSVPMQMAQVVPPIAPAAPVVPTPPTQPTAPVTQTLPTQPTTPATQTALTSPAMPVTPPTQAPVTPPPAPPATPPPIAQPQAPLPPQAPSNINNVNNPNGGTK